VLFSSDFSGLTLPVVEFRCINGGLLPGRRPLRLDGDEPGEDRAGGGGGRVALSMVMIGEKEETARPNRATEERGVRLPFSG
jgi:hypothetical protein